VRKLIQKKKKNRKGVFETYTDRLNPIYVLCGYNCSYCYLKPLRKRFPKNFQPGFYIKRLEEKRNMKNKTFFIETNCDVFDKKVQDKWIYDMIKYIKKNYDRSNTFCMLTKNPERYLDFIDIIPKDWLLGVTIETNYSNLINKISNAPNPLERYMDMQELKLYHDNIYVMIEPVMDFNEIFMEWLINLDAKYYLFGANSAKNIKLKEPSYYFAKSLILALKQNGKIVIIKDNMKRLGFKTKIGYLKKDISDFRFETEEKPELTTLEKYMELSK